MLGENLDNKYIPHHVEPKTTLLHPYEEEYDVKEKEKQVKKMEDEIKKLEDKVSQLKKKFITTAIEDEIESFQSIILNKKFELEKFKKAS